MKLLLVAVLTTLVGCDFSKSSSTSVVEAPEVEPLQIEEISANTVSLVASNNAVDDVVAVVEGEKILLSEIDKKNRLANYDLDWARYTLREATLKERIDSLAPDITRIAQLEIYLQPPEPPRLKVNLSDQPSAGPEGAPIEISVFCSYQSSHCARQLKVYDSLKAKYGELLVFRYVDFPQPFHPNARLAANAARCAHRLGKFNEFNTALYANANRLEVALFTQLAKQLHLDATEFSKCIEQKRFLDQIDANFILANQLGFSNVPVTLINGLYANGPKSLDLLSHFIDLELERLGVVMQSAQDLSNAVLEATALPLRLVGITLSGNDSNTGIATVENTADDITDNYSVGDRIYDSTTLISIVRNRIIIDNKGKLEYLALNGATTDSDATLPDSAEISAASPVTEESADPLEQELPLNAQDNLVGSQSGENTEAGEDETEYGPDTVVEAIGETPLSRQWLNEQLLDRHVLEESIFKADHEVEGSRLLKLADVSESEFYSTLGLQNGDVIMRVNDEWVHEFQNTLFSELYEKDTVSLVFVRKGQPIHNIYKISDNQD